MENFEKIMYTQSDDRCIPPSEKQDCNSVSEIRINNVANNDLKAANSSGTCMQKDENIKTINVTQSLPKSDKNDGFVLTVENLNRIKCERQINMEEKDTMAENLKNMPDRNLMTPSPTLKLEMKTESMLITDALSLNKKSEKIPKDIESGASEVGNLGQLVSKRTEKEGSQLKNSSDTKVTNPPIKISTKTEHNYHKNENVDSSKLEKDNR